MSQNRQASRDSLAAGLDYEVKLKAEIEIIELHEKLDRILAKHLDELLRTQWEQPQLLTQLAPTMAMHSNREMISRESDEGSLL